MYFCSTFTSLGIMKKFVWVLCTLVVFFMACTGNKGSESDGEEALQVNQIVEQSDTLTNEDVEEALPARADELFDDFMFNYSKDSTVQMRRTSFPLPYFKREEKTNIARSDWKKDPMFSDMDFYSVLYNHPSDNQMEKDTAVNRVQMEYLYLDRMEAKRYHFLRNPKGFWILYKIVEEPLDEQRDPLEFLQFYAKFANDSVFQREHVAERLNFITFDPDDEFRTVECDITVDQWFAFRPDMPKHQLTQVNYGQSTEGVTDKIINFRSGTTGFNNTLTFKRVEDSWMLTSFEDTSE